MCVWTSNSAMSGACSRNRSTHGLSISSPNMRRHPIRRAYSGFVIELRAGDLEATFVPDAGMVGSSLRHHGEELLGQRGGLEAYRDRWLELRIPARPVGEPAPGAEVGRSSSTPTARR